MEGKRWKMFRKVKVLTSPPRPLPSPFGQNGQKLVFRPFALLDAGCFVCPALIGKIALFGKGAFCTYFRFKNEQLFCSIFVQSDIFLSLPPEGAVSTTARKKGAADRKPKTLLPT